jgi:hypothetical protein
VAVFCGSLNSGTARAAIIIAVPTMSLPYSPTDRTETLEVYVQDPNDPSPPQIGDQQVMLSLPDTLDVFFTAAGPTIAHPYLFAPQMPGTSVSNDVVYGTDFPQDIAPPVLANGAGLLMIEFTVKGGTTGDFPLTFDTDLLADPGATALLDQEDHPISFCIENGAIDIAPMPVPEPSSGLLSMLAALIGGFAVYRHRRQNASRLNRGKGGFFIFRFWPYRPIRLAAPQHRRTHEIESSRRHRSFP